MNRQIQDAMTTGVALLLATVLVVPTGCEFLEDKTGIRMNAPLVALRGDAAVLVEAPSLDALTRFYCGDVLDFPADQACLLLGAVPSDQDLHVPYLGRIPVAAGPFGSAEDPLIWPIRS